MTPLHPPFFLGLPTTEDLVDSPERAIFAALDANLILAVRVLEVLHQYPDSEDRLALFAEAVRASAQSLHTNLVAYNELVRRAVLLEHRHSCPDPPWEDGEPPF